MRYLISVLLSVLFASQAFGVVLIQRGGGGTECSGDLLFYSSFENDFDPTVGSPPGCWVVELFETNNGMAFIDTPAPPVGTYSLRSSHVSNSVSYGVTNLGISPASGTVSLYLYQDDLAAGRDIFVIDDGGTLNRILLLTDSTNSDELLLRYRRSGEWTSLSSVGCDLAADVWNFIQVSWNTSSSPYLSITCHTGGAAVVTTHTTAISGGAWAGPTRFMLGSAGGLAVLGLWDEVRVYGVSQE